MICPNCGNVSEDKSFCATCGAELSSPLAPTAPAPGAMASPVTGSPPSESGNLTGRTLDQKYYLESKLGAGVMGNVYRARRLLIGDRVVVKVLHPGQVTDPQAIERFRRVAQAAASLKHPNVITIYDFGVSSEGLNYLVMELAEGENLRHLIDRKGKLTQADAVAIIRQVCAALEEAHKQDVVHREIKPENIIAQTLPDGLRVKVLDFGMAALRNVTTSRLTRTGAVVGTPHYMSPERCLGEELDRRSDIYSLGVVLFEMLTGVVPFDSPIPSALVVKQVYEPPPRPRALNPNISPEVETVMLHALEKWRDARPQTAGEMARELSGAVQSAGQVRAQESITPAPIPTPTPVPTPTPAPKPTLMLTLTPVKVPTPASRKNMARPHDVAPVVGKLFAKKGWTGKPVLPVFGALLLLICGGGLWWYLHKGGDEKAAATSNSARSSQKTSAAGGQPAATTRHATVSHSTSPPVSNKHWELISGQTSGVTDAANALGTANQQVTVIHAGGQLALDYREGKFFSDGIGSDVRVYGPEQGRVSYLIFVRNDPAEDWKRIDINRKGFLGGEAGHDMGHHGVRQARQLMIKNIGNADLRIYAVSVVYKNEINDESATRHQN